MCLPHPTNQGCVPPIISTIFPCLLHKQGIKDCHSPPENTILTAIKPKLAVAGNRLPAWKLLSQSNMQGKISQQTALANVRTLSLQKCSLTGRILLPWNVSSLLFPQLSGILCQPFLLSWSIFEQRLTQVPLAGCAAKRSLPRPCCLPRAH